jgi:hypothetical protein
MDAVMENYIYTCPHCGGRLNSWFRGNFKGRYLNTKLDTFRMKYFCTEKCYKNYKENFIVETYNDNTIFCVEIRGEKRYMPYFEANYYFTNINDCKKRINMRGVSVVSKAALMLILQQY